jgi:hypothetical protein
MGQLIVCEKSISPDTAAAVAREMSVSEGIS